MKKLFLAGSLALLVVGVVVTVAPARDGKGKKSLSGDLVGFSEVPSISTTGHGEINVRPHDNSIDFTLKYSDLEAPVKFAHIHLSEEHVNGAVVAFLCGGGGKPACPNSGTVNGTITANDVVPVPAQGIADKEIGEVIRAIKAGATYANVHTDTFPTGEIRGQIGDDDGDDHEGHDGNGDEGNNRNGHDEDNRGHGRDHDDN
jgi:hypothetical protein